MLPHACNSGFRGGHIAAESFASVFVPARRGEVSQGSLGPTLPQSSTEISRMSADSPDIQQVEELLTHPELAAALEDKQFRRFLNSIPIAIAISRLNPVEKIIYVNPRFEKLTGEKRSAVEGRRWDVLHGSGEGENAGAKLETAIVEKNEWVGTFRIEVDGQPDILTEVYSNLIEDDEGRPAFRLAALVDMR